MPKIKYYEITQFIGKGSFSKVYKGEDTRNGNIVALKCDTSSMKVLKHEVSILNYYIEKVLRIYLKYIGMVITWIIHHW